MVNHLAAIARSSYRIAINNVLRSYGIVQAGEKELLLIK